MIHVQLMSQRQPHSCSDTKTSDSSSDHGAQKTAKAHSEHYRGHQRLMTNTGGLNGTAESCLWCGGRQSTLYGGGGSYPNISLGGDAGSCIQVNHLWSPIGQCGVPAGGTRGVSATGQRSPAVITTLHRAENENIPGLRTEVHHGSVERFQAE